MRNKRLIILFCILFAITTLIVLSSAVFSVRSVYGYCANADDEGLCDRVANLEVNGIKTGRSIFLLSEKKIAAAVEDKLPEVEVVNVERKFPDRVYINFRKLFPYYAIAAGEQTLLAGDGGKILSVTDNADGYVKFTTLGAPNETTAGKKAYGEDTTEGKFIKLFTDTVNKLKILDYTSLQKKMEIFESIDVSKLSTNDEFYVKLRTGTEIEFSGNLDDLVPELRLALSTYFNREDDYMNKKMRVYFNHDEKVNAYVVTVGEKDN